MVFFTYFDGHNGPCAVQHNISHGTVLTIEEAQVVTLISISEQLDYICRELKGKNIPKENQPNKK